MIGPIHHDETRVPSIASVDHHLALVSLKEELDAIDWYHQRAGSCGDDELRRIFTHNEHEEVEHAMMLIEWLRRNHLPFAANVERYVDSLGPIVGVEHSQARAPVLEDQVIQSLGVGSLKVMK